MPRSRLAGASLALLILVACTDDRRRRPNDPEDLPPFGSGYYGEGAGGGDYGGGFGTGAYGTAAGGAGYAGSYGTGAYGTSAGGSYGGGPGGFGGAFECYTCAEMITEPDVAEYACPRSVEILDAFLQCTCFFECSAECASECIGEAPSDACIGCAQTACSETFYACVNDA